MQQPLSCWYLSLSIRSWAPGAPWQWILCKSKRHPFCLSFVTVVFFFIRGESERFGAQ